MVVVSWGVVTHDRAILAGVSLGEGLPVAVMGALNVSPESFYGDSVYVGDDDLVRAGLAMVEAGAALIDVGARSTAPYGGTAIGQAEERDRLGHAVDLLVGKLSVPISADTCRPEPARAALEAGARVVNDVSGLADARVARLAADHGASVVLMASRCSGVPEPGTAESGLREMRRLGGRASATLTPTFQTGAPASGSDHPDSTGLRPPPGPASDPVATVRRLLEGALGRARAAGILDERVVLDPGVGFFRREAIPWDEWDVRVLAGLPTLRQLGRPLCVGVSRKSFIGAITGRRTPGERLAGSLAATAVAVLNGAALIRTHDVRETRDAVGIAERIREASRA